MKMPTVLWQSDFFLLLGVILFCAGTMLGVPHGLSKRSGDTKRIELWRVAHLSTCVGGISVIVLTLALERLLGDTAVYALTAFSVAAYSFFLACTLSGCLNRAWDDDRRRPSVMLIYGVQIFASMASMVAVAVVLIALISRGLS